MLGVRALHERARSEGAMRYASDTPLAIAPRLGTQPPETLRFGDPLADAGGIHESAQHGDEYRLRQILARGVSPDEPKTGAFEAGRTPLHVLCRGMRTIAGGRVEVGDRPACFELLRAAGANLEAVDPNGYVPLHVACLEAEPVLAAKLIEAGVSVNVVTETGMTPLHYAAYMDMEDTVTLLLKAGAAVNVKDEDGTLPLFLAVYANKRRIIPLLLRAGAVIPSTVPDWAPQNLFNTPYLDRVVAAGGFKKYEQAHITRVTAVLTPTPRLPPEMVRKIVEFWLHASYY